MTLEVPATYGGPGWRPRQRTHREDVQDGVLWRCCGVRSEIEDLREVLLAWPERHMLPDGDPNESLFLQWPDTQKLRVQAAAIAEFYERQGVKVHWAQTPLRSPNFLFQRDLFFMTPEGAVLARPASEQRASEARIAATVLSSLGIPILAMPRGDAVFEGADALWVDETTVLIGIGLRTNVAGARWLSDVLRDIGIDSMRVTLPSGIQHLLGVANFIDRDLAAVRADKLSDELRAIVRSFGKDTVLCGPGEETCAGLAMNFVTMAPRRVVMPAGFPSVRERLCDAGVLVHEIEVSEYCKAAGGLGCLTGIIHRRH